MELEHSFTVPVPVERAWDVLLDVERVAPCMPGATLDSVEGDVIKGRIKVKVGPISMTYAGTAKFTERDRVAGVVTLDAAGKETRGAGTASATIRSELHDRGDKTDVIVHTSLNVTGRPAQFGRGVMAEISGKLIGIFADNLADMLASGSSGTSPAEAAPAIAETPAAVVASADTSTARTGGASDGQSLISPGPQVPAAAADVPAVSRTSDDAINLLDVAGLPVLKRAIPAAAGLALAACIALWLSGKRRRNR